MDADLGTIQEYLVQRTINGPRDPLLLVDLSRQTAAAERAQKITLSLVEASEYDYGKKKLRQLTSNFQRIYDDIDRVIDRVFREGKQKYERKALERHINFKDDMYVERPFVSSGSRPLTDLSDSGQDSLIRQLLCAELCAGFEGRDGRLAYYRQRPGMRPLAR